MLAGSGLWLMGSGAGFILLQALALGLQNGVVQSLRSAKVHSTYITGMSTSLINSLANGCQPQERALRRTLLRGILAFVVGALLGGVLTERFAVLGFLALLLPLLAAARLSQRLPDEG